MRRVASRRGITGDKSSLDFVDKILRPKFRLAFPIGEISKHVGDFAGMGSMAWIWHRGHMLVQCAGAHSQQPTSQWGTWPYTKRAV